MTIQRLLSKSGQPIDWAGLRVAAGDFAKLASLYKFGFFGAVTTTEGTVWDEGGAYAYPGAATAMTVSSSDANDTSAGTGARTVQWFGLDTDYAEVNETVTLNGQTAVTTTTEFLRVFRGIVRTAGSGGQNAGDLYIGTGTVTAGVPANVFGKIAVGNNQTLMAVYTIPANKIGYLAQFFATTAGNSTTTATVRLIARPNGEVFQTKDQVVVAQAGGPLPIEHKMPVSFAAKTDIEVRAASSSGTVDVSAAFEMVIADF